MIEKEKSFPNFQLTNQNGDVRTLSNYKDKWLIIFFYSKNNTSACTSEVNDFNKYFEQISKLGANIIGISGDTVSSHKKFAEKLEIKYDLLSDTNRDFINTSGFLIDKKMYGKDVKGVNRSTFIINDKGIVKEIWTKVKVKEHIEEVLQKLTELHKQL